MNTEDRKKYAEVIKKAVSEIYLYYNERFIIPSAVLLGLSECLSLGEDSIFLKDWDKTIKVVAVPKISHLEVLIPYDDILSLYIRPVHTLPEGVKIRHGEKVVLKPLSGVKNILKFSEVRMSEYIEKEYTEEIK